MTSLSQHYYGGAAAGGAGGAQNDGRGWLAETWVFFLNLYARIKALFIGASWDLPLFAVEIKLASFQQRWRATIASKGV